jgi:hypothetical protein
LAPAEKQALISILVEEVPTEHMNLTMLTVANLVVYRLRISRTPLSQQLFTAWYNQMFPIIMKDYKTGAKNVDFNLVNAKVKSEFYLYILYVMKHAKDFSIEKRLL